MLSSTRNNTDRPLIKSSLHDEQLDVDDVWELLMSELGGSAGEHASRQHRLWKAVVDVARLAKEEDLSSAEADDLFRVLVAAYVGNIVEGDVNSYLDRNPILRPLLRGLN